MQCLLFRCELDFVADLSVNVAKIWQRGLALRKELEDPQRRAKLWRSAANNRAGLDMSILNDVS